MFALVDCNNFYASCEQLFRPDLRHRPVVVLSNNDGCVVSRSPAAKALGIPMGEPAYRLREAIARHDVEVFSSNYALYADISQRVMRILAELAPEVELYSIDEAFLDVGGIADLEAFGQRLRTTVRQWTGITVAIGMAPTKTLAKLANAAAKRFPATGGVVDLRDRKRQLRLLRIMPVEEVWGVGRRLSRRLRLMGIETAFDLGARDKGELRRRFSVTLARTAAELDGVPCFGLDEAPPPRKQIISSRSFGERVTGLAAMHQAVCAYTATACEKLRRGRQYARSMSVFIQTSPHAAAPYYGNAAHGSLPGPSGDTRDFHRLSRRLLESIWKEGHAYVKAGVMLHDCCPTTPLQLSLLGKQGLHASDTLMAALDRINHSGRGRVFWANQGIDPSWTMFRNHLSPAYTTNWSAIPCVR
ncbi:MAG: translesion error-prone DNA polymerase V subunit UmuC [Desulfobulbus sp.]|uniref:translesion error-prone DNA polymerase V subunit UmuC n=1 Tax=Desulfobulbus sp. TaxID=895 RepID=UPI00283E7408|nr:translesion error-prone DNA polymerase V subunit UmuC [Desulfobulbus sp.]MDR2549558.1 translesion error-prone DNA polymerase V subunit UmuC [Desulfobulbus sp.]